MSLPRLPFRVARRLPTPDLRLAAGVALVALSVLGGLRLSASSDAAVAVLSAAGDLPTGRVLTARDLTVSRVHASPAVLEQLVRASERARVAGRVLSGPTAKGMLLSRAALVDGVREGREVTVPVTAEHALGGRVRVGDRVDVLASFGKNGADAKTLAVVSDAEVVDVVRPRAEFGAGERAPSALTLTVPPDVAVSLAFAVRNADLDVVRATGGPPAGRQRFDAAELP